MENQPLLLIRIEGQAIGEGRIGVSHLLRLLTQLNKILMRSGQVLRGEAFSLRKGPKEKQVKEVIALELVKLTHGSPAVLLGFDRQQEDKYLPGMDPGLEVLEKAIIGLEIVEKPDRELPAGYDTGVLMAWRDMGILFDQGVETIQFSLNHRPQPKTVCYERPVFESIQQRIQGPNINIRTVEGRLLMADFKEHGTRCRVHPALGDPVLCLFAEEQKDEVLENILHYVRVIGEAKEDPLTNKINSIRIHDIQRLEDHEDERTDLIPQGAPVPMDFWRSLSLDELAESQRVKPLSEIKILFGTWPGDELDGFEDDIRVLRQASLAGGNE